MTSPASGPYQSRFFNFLLRQTRRVANECDRAFRHAKVAAVWGVQLLFSPAYWFWGSDRQDFQPLQGTPQPKRSLFSTTSETSTAPVVDRPLEKVFEALQETAPNTFQVPAANEIDAASPWQKLTGKLTEKFTDNIKTIKQQFKTWLGAKSVIANPEKSTDLSLATPKNSSILQAVAPPDYSLQVKSGKITPVIHAVRGIATLLENRQLVLVTPNNEILDCLTLPQKQLLAQRIEQEIAAYLQALQLYLAHHQKQVVLPAFLRKIVALPVTQNVVQRLQKILPRSSAKLELLPGNDPENFGFPVPVHPWLQSLDQALVKLERSPLKLSSKIPFNLREVSFPHSTAMTPSLGEQISQFPEQLKELLQAAIQYFFGFKPQPPLQQTSLSDSWKGTTQFSAISSQIPLGSLPSASPNLEDPWLTEEELFGQPVIQAVKDFAIEDSPPLNLPALPEVPAVNWRKSFLDVLKQTLRFLKQSPKAAITIPSNLSEVPASGNNLLEVETFPINLALVSPKTEKITLNSATSSAISQPNKPQSKSSKSNRNSNSKKSLKIPNLSYYVTENASIHQGTTESESTLPLTAKTATKFATHRPDWIETEAETMGYVKHPLEILLEWLDGIMFWLETLLVNFWSFLKGLFHKS